MLEPILVVGLNRMFTWGTIWNFTHGHVVFGATTQSFVRAAGQGRPNVGHGQNGGLSNNPLFFLLFFFVFFWVGGASFIFVCFVFFFGGGGASCFLFCFCVFFWGGSLRMGGFAFNFPLKAQKQDLMSANHF